MTFTCIYCGGSKFLEGPSGSASTNILCANPDCRHWFNYHGGVGTMDDLHRVEPSAAEKAKRADSVAERMNTGAQAYREHGSIAVLRQKQLETRWTNPQQSHIDEICGFIMAMTDEIKTLREELAILGVQPVKLRSAYGPGSITDAASYESNFPTDAERVKPIQEASSAVLRGVVERAGYVDSLYIFARFCAFLDAYDGHPVEAFQKWMEKEGKPLSSQDLTFFKRTYHKEE